MKEKKEQIKYYTRKLKPLNEAYRAKKEQIVKTKARLKKQKLDFEKIRRELSMLRTKKRLIILGYTYY